MEITLLKGRSFISQNWEGGTTTELYCFPPSANYKERNFDFRLSTATVEVESSIFTPLEGVARTLMVLEGEMKLNHENHHTKHLEKFDFDNFNGGWKTSSEGTCTDFNLMVRGAATGDLEGISLAIEKERVYFPNPDSSYEFIYVYHGNVKVNWNNQTWHPAKGDLLVIENPEKTDLTVKGIINSEVVLVSITV